MQPYPSDKIRNVSVVAHSAAGKTSLLDALAYQKGLHDRFGRVDDGTSAIDTNPEEVESKLTITAKIFPIEHQGVKINCIDTPGYPDFYGEVVGANRVVEQSILVVCGVSGVEIGTAKVWNDLETQGVPTLAFVNKLDKERASLDGAVKSLKQSFKGNFVPFQLPLGEGPGHKGVVEVLTRKAFIAANGKVTEQAAPAEMEGALAKAREAIVEAAAEGDDALLEKFLDSGELTDAELAVGLRGALTQRKLIPVFCGSATLGTGVEGLLRFLAGSGLSPLDHTILKTAAGEPRKCDPAGAPVAFIFKVAVEQHVGELNFIRMVQGKLTAGTDLINSRNSNKERVGQMLVMRGKNKEEIKELHAGDIAALVKLKSTVINDTLYAKEEVTIAPIPFPQPMVAVAVVPKSKADQERLSTGLSAAMQEDPTFKLELRPEFAETVVLGMGERQINLKVARLKKKYNVDVEMVKPKVPYRETIRARGDSKYRHKKQTGGAGQFAEVWLRIEPLPRGSGIQFINSLVGQNVDRVFVPSVEKGVNAAVTEGALAGYKIVDVKVDFYDGKMHPVDSKDIAFQVAGKMAFREALLAAKPILIEPIMELEITVDSEYTGPVMSDINSRRGKVLGMDSCGRFQIIRAQIPDAELYKYATDLRSQTQGKGSFTMKLSHYEDLPHELAQKVITESKKAESKGE